MLGTQGQVWLFDDIAFLIALIPFALLLLVIIMSLVDTKRRSKRLSLMSSAQRLKVTAADERARALSKISEHASHNRRAA